MTDISQLNAAELLRLYRRKELSPVEVVRDALDRIARFEPQINAFVLVDADGALAAARASEARWAKGEPMGLVDGLPATIKDIIDVKGKPTRKGSLTTPDNAGRARRARGGAAARSKAPSSSARPPRRNSAGSAPAIRR